VAAANALLIGLFVSRAFPEAATAANAVMEHRGISFAANYTFYNNLSISFRQNLLEIMVLPVISICIVTALEVG
jgi:hypothetical protein